VDFILIGMTFVLAVIGTLWKDPPKTAQAALLLLLLASSTVSVFKSVGDSRDKELLQTLAVAGLNLPNAAYDIVYRPMEEWQKAEGYSNSATCHHNGDGMTCFVDPVPNKPDIVFVLNRFEVAKIYAMSIRGESNNALLTSVLQKKYDPKELNDDYQDKLGILGEDVFYHLCARFPSNYNYDDKFGIAILYEQAGTQKAIQISPTEMTAPEPDIGPIIFQHFAQMYRDRIRVALPECEAGPK